MGALRLFSLPPRLIAVLDATISLLMVFWFDRVTSMLVLATWLVVRVLWYVVLLAGMYYPTFLSRLEHFQALVIFNIGVVFLLLFVDETSARRLLELVLIFFSAASFWLVPGSKDDLSVMAKPYRRWKFLMSIFGVAGIWNGLKALEIFQVTQGSLRLGLVVSAIAFTVLISIWGWQEYGLRYSKKFLAAALIIALCLAEAAYIIALWPLGYFASSLVITWTWYLLWLFLRFYISDEGVDMHRQRWFLLMNALLLLSFLFFVVRWK